VARDATGSFRVTWCMAYSEIVDPLTSKALVLPDAVVFAQAQKFSRITIETDCLELMRLWEARKRSRPVISLLQ
jgi:hypothetical protein